MTGLSAKWRLGKKPISDFLCEISKEYSVSRADVVIHIIGRDFASFDQRIMSYLENSDRDYQSVMAIFEALKKGSFSRNVLEDYEVRTTRTVLVEKNLKCVYLASLDIHVHAEDIFAILVKFFLGNTPVPAYYTFTVYKLSIKLSAISAKGEIVDSDDLVVNFSKMKYILP
jgi:hypothetical protein